MSGKRALGCLVAIALIGCSDGESGSDPGGAGGAAGAAGAAAGGAAGAPGTAGPLYPSDSWEVQSPDEQGMDSAVLEGARDYAFAPGKNTQGVVVTRRGALVAEWYEGADADSFATSWSVGKSFASAAIGIAIDEGLIPSVDVAMTEYYPEWAGTEREAITLRHVLQMASGLQWDESYDPADLSSSDVIQLVLRADQLDYAQGRPSASAPGGTFNYSSGDTLLLSGVIEQATGMSAFEYAQEKIFEPLGMDGAQWWQDTLGRTLTYCCLDTTSRNFARFGLLYLRGGAWRGEQIVSEQWVADSTEPSPAFVGYGYKWWLTGQTREELPEDVYSARGHDGQYIYVVPSLELVVVRNGKYLKFDGEPIADPNLFGKLPSDGFGENLGSYPPDEWSDVSFLRPILDSVVER